MVVLCLAGGQSARFYPCNKIFTRLVDPDRSMIQQTLDRATSSSFTEQPLCTNDSFYIITGPSFEHKMREELHNIPKSNIYIEPARRNTLPAILWALATLRAKGVDSSSVVSVVTADHVIPDVDEFRRCLRLAQTKASSSSCIVTIGITPSSKAHEWTSFGTMKTHNSHSTTSTGHPLARFEEKPSLERAKEMLEEGGWYWNSGMFVFAIETLEMMLQCLQPPMYQTYTALVDAHTSGDASLAADLFASFPSKIPHPLVSGILADNSIDYALMVPLTLGQTLSEGIFGFVVPGTFEWLDIGSWSALRKVHSTDDSNNIILGDVVFNNCSNCIFVAEQPCSISVNDVSGLIIVVNSSGELMLSPEDIAAEVKTIASKAAVREEKELVVVENVENCEFIGDKLITAIGIRNISVKNFNGRITVEQKN
ncbi:hypothetical protein RCL1_006640 [Eukaryota sp. TZLM3-RCL]